MIYALVSREQVVLSDFTPHSGNFRQVTIDVPLPLSRCWPRPISAKPSDSTPPPTTPSTPTSRKGSSSSSWSSPPYPSPHSVRNAHRGQLPQKNSGFLLQPLRPPEEGLRSRPLPQRFHTHPQGVDGQVQQQSRGR